jgi:hypothetical protein
MIWTKSRYLHSEVEFARKIASKHGKNPLDLHVDRRSCVVCVCVYACTYVCMYVHTQTFIWCVCVFLCHTGDDPLDLHVDGPSCVMCVCMRVLCICTMCMYHVLMRYACMFACTMYIYILQGPNLLDLHVNGRSCVMRVCMYLYVCMYVLVCMYA